MYPFQLSLWGFAVETQSHRCGVILKYPSDKKLHGLVWSQGSNTWLPFLCPEALSFRKTLCGVLQHPQLVKQHHIEEYQQYQATERGRKHRLYNRASSITWLNAIFWKESGSQLQWKYLIQILQNANENEQRKTSVTTTQKQRNNSRKKCTLENIEPEQKQILKKHRKIKHKIVYSDYNEHTSDTTTHTRLMRTSSLEKL